MKKLIFGLLLFAFAFVGNAQTVITPLSGTSMVKSYYNASHVLTYITVDTVTNTGTNYLQNKYLVSGSAQSVTIQWYASKISGTIAGTVTLQGSLDGINWVTITGNNTVNNVSISTYTATNVTSQSYVWVLQNNPFPWYRVTWTGAGTMAAIQQATFNAH